MKSLSESVQVARLARRSPSAVRKLQFLAILIGFLVAAQECLFRVVFPLPEVSGFNRIQYTPLVFGEQLSPTSRRGLSNTRTRWMCEPEGMSFDQTLNIYGFRGPDFAIAPAADRQRVLFIGDSFTEGCGTDDAHTIPRLFQKGLGKDHIEAINLGVGGANFPEYVRMARDTVSLLRPCHVFLTVCSNDLPTPGVPDDIDRPVGPFSRQSAVTPRALDVTRRAISGQGVPTRFLRGPWPFFEAVPAKSNPWSGDRVPVAGLDGEVLSSMKRGTMNPWLEATWDNYEKYLRQDSESLGAGPYLTRIAEQCRLAGCGLTLVYIPWHVMVSPEYTAATNRLGGRPLDEATRHEVASIRNQQRHLRIEADRLGISFVDTTDAFIAAEKTRRMFWALDGHCNEAGYRLIADLCRDQWLRAADR
ncbi:MAG: SGNH/GDSL hydrolase family protein [Gemmataceae bacterium]|nr:SGNH/GDSL hydrolase family protein [Gemmataceae bacterium]